MILFFQMPEESKNLFFLRMQNNVFKLQEVEESPES